MKVEDVIKTIKADLERLRIEALSKRPVAPSLKPEDFKELMILECTRVLISRRVFKEFVVDDDNKKVIHNLYHYLIYSQGFHGDLQKGILLLGAIGTGKTVILQGFAGVIERLTGKVFVPYSALDLNMILLRDELSKFSKNNILIDDLGKEEPVVKDYGTERRPLLELFASRYDSGALTFVTANYNMKTFEDKYGLHTVDRFKEMFNVMELLGKSRRS